MFYRLVRKKLARKEANPRLLLQNPPPLLLRKNSTHLQRTPLLTLPLLRP